MRLACLLLLAMIAPGAAQPLSLSGDQRWIVVASRQNLDAAIGVARSYTDAEVVRSVNGWYGVVIGPKTVRNPRAMKTQLINDEQYPKDLVFSKGDNYVERVWRQKETVPLRRLEMNADHTSLSTSHEGLDITLALTKPDADGQRIPVITGMAGGKPAFSVTMKEAEREAPYATVELHRLDPASPRPQVMIAGFTGGAHCCMASVIATSDAAGTWHTVTGLTLDGGGYWAEDVDGDGQLELLHADNAFLYAFSSYAGSHPPRRIVRLAGTELKDVTGEPRYLPYHRQEVARLEHLAERAGDRLETNGFLAGWVAAKSRIGEAREAWDIMLKRQERTQGAMYEKCLVDAPLDSCPKDQLRKIDFPEALARHLRANGYNLPF